MNVQRLRSGAEMPAVGLGLWKIAPDRVGDMVVEAIRAGYRHLDSACDYGNESEAGAGIRAALDQELVAREDLWVTSKLWNTYHQSQHVRPALERSLSDLGLEYLDLYLVHFPIALAYVPFDTRYPPEWLYEPSAAEPVMQPVDVPLQETWEAMEGLVQSGLVRHVGICNYNIVLLRELMKTATVQPEVLQVECHPWLAQPKLLRFCREAGIAMTAYSPLGGNSYMEIGMAAEDESLLVDETVTDIAGEHERTAAQVLLRWGLQRGTSVIPKTSRVERLAENLDLFDFELSDSEMQRLDALDRGRRFNDPGVFAERNFNTFFPIYD